jgi:hypothetical protein
MPMTIDPFAPNPEKPDPAMSILKIQSRTHDELDPGAFFEWHQTTRKVYVVRPQGSIGNATLLFDGVHTPMEAKLCVAAYVQGFAHGRNEQGANKL